MGSTGFIDFVQLTGVLLRLVWSEIHGFHWFHLRVQLNPTLVWVPTDHQTKQGQE